MKDLSCLAALLSLLLTLACDSAHKNNTMSPAASVTSANEAERPSAVPVVGSEAAPAASSAAPSPRSSARPSNSVATSRDHLLYGVWKAKSHYSELGAKVFEDWTLRRGSSEGGRYAIRYRMVGSPMAPKSYTRRGRFERRGDSITLMSTKTMNALTYQIVALSADEMKLRNSKGFVIRMGRAKEELK